MKCLSGINYFFQLPILIYPDFLQLFPGLGDTLSHTHDEMLYFERLREQFRCFLFLCLLRHFSYNP